MLLYLEKAEDFEKQLPADTKEELAKGDKGAFLGCLGSRYPTRKINEWLLSHESLAQECGFRKSCGGTCYNIMNAAESENM